MSKSQKRSSVGLIAALTAVVILGLICWLAVRVSGGERAVASGKSDAGQVPQAAESPPESGSRDIMSRLKPKAIPELDSRKAIESSILAKARESAVTELQEKIPGVQIDFDAITGAPSNIVAVGKFLTGPNQKAGGNSDPLDAIRRFVDDNAALFGHPSAVLNQGNSRVSRDDVTAYSGLKTVVWQQELDGIPLFNTILKANLTKKDEIVTLSSHLSDPAAASVKRCTRGRGREGGATVSGFGKGTMQWGEVQPGCRAFANLEIADKTASARLQQFRRSHAQNPELWDCHPGTHYLQKLDSHER